MYIVINFIELSIDFVRDISGFILQEVLAYVETMLAHFPPQLEYNFDLLNYKMLHIGFIYETQNLYALNHHQ